MVTGSVPRPPTMPDDPLLHFGQQQDSWELLQRYGPDLAARAAAFTAQHPDIDVAGVVTTEDASEGKLLRARSAHVVAERPGLWVGLVTMPDLRDVLEKNTPHMLRWLDGIEWSPVRRLTMVAFTKDGARGALRPYSD